MSILRRVLLWPIIVANVWYGLVLAMLTGMAVDGAPIHEGMKNPIRRHTDAEGLYITEEPF